MGICLYNGPHRDALVCANQGTVVGVVKHHPLLDKAIELGQETILVQAGFHRVVGDESIANTLYETECRASSSDRLGY